MEGSIVPETMDTQESGYEILEHTADIGVAAWGPTVADAFAAAARGMFAIILGSDPQEWRGGGRPATIEVEVSGDDWPALLVNWLSELLFHFEVGWFVPLSYEFQECAPPRCRARVGGRHLERFSDVCGVGVKAVTYHQIAVQVGPSRTDVRVIFDI